MSCYVSNKYKIIVITNARCGTKFFNSMFSFLEDKEMPQGYPNPHSWTNHTFGMKSRRYPKSKYKVFVFTRNPYEQKISTSVAHNANRSDYKNKTYKEFIMSYKNFNPNIKLFYGGFANEVISKYRITEYTIMHNDNFIENVNKIMEHIGHEHRYKKNRDKSFKNYGDYHNEILAYDIKYPELYKLLYSQNMPNVRYFYTQEMIDIVFHYMSNYFKMFRIPININDMIPKNAKKNVGFVIEKDGLIINY